MIGTLNISQNISCPVQSKAMMTVFDQKGPIGSLADKVVCRLYMIIHEFY